MKEFNQPKGFPGRYTVPACKGVFGDVLDEFSRSGLPYLRASLARANSETKSMAVHIPRRLRGDLTWRGRSLRGPWLSPESSYYTIYGLSGRISATLSSSCFTVSGLIRRLLYRPVAYCNPPRLRGSQVVGCCCQYKRILTVILLKD